MRHPAHGDENRRLHDSQRLRDLIDVHGGFTVRLRTGRAVPSGISVAMRSSQSFTFGRDRWCDADVAEWLAQIDRCPAWRRRSIGGWLDTRSQTVWLDVVRVLPSSLRRPACLLGKAMRQHCVFDLGRRETLVLRPMLDPETR
jgi:hypothetical protein